LSTLYFPNSINQNLKTLRSSYGSPLFERYISIENIFFQYDENWLVLKTGFSNMPAGYKKEAVNSKELVYRKPSLFTDIEMKTSHIKNEIFLFMILIPCSSFEGFFYFKIWALFW